MIPRVNFWMPSGYVMEKLIKEPPRDGGPKEDLVYNVNNADLVFNSDNCKLLESQKPPIIPAP